MRRVLRAAAVCVVCVALLWGAATAALYATMRQTPETFGRVMSQVPGFAMMVLPFKTLLLPMRRYAPDEHLTLRSVSALYTIQLKEPIDEQGDFIWSPFEIVARRLRTDSRSAATTSGT